jgi:hypothetical protein
LPPWETHLQEVRADELQARFHDIIGEATRSPNKKFLLRRIAEALEAQEQEAAEAASRGRGDRAHRVGVGDRDRERRAQAHQALGRRATGALHRGRRTEQWLE